MKSDGPKAGFMAAPRDVGINSDSEMDTATYLVSFFKKRNEKFDWIFLRCQACAVLKY